MIRARSQAREAALKALYQLDMRDDLGLAEVDALLRCDLSGEDALVFARGLVRGTRDRMEEIDRAIESVAINWNLRRMATIDRNVLRLGAYELLFRPDLPPAVSISEAVILAKKYSTKDSGSFVNGILDELHRRNPRAGGAGAAGAGAADPGGSGGSGLRGDDAAPPAGAP